MYVCVCVFKCVALKCLNVCLFVYICVTFIVKSVYVINCIIICMSVKQEGCNSNYVTRYSKEYPHFINHYSWYNDICKRFVC